jgi:hypothetical protein
MSLVAAVAAAIIGVAVPAEAAPPTYASVPTVAVPTATAVPADTGADISWPQCASSGSASMKSPSPLAGLPFAVIGVNGGMASTFNTCFHSEYDTALILKGTTAQPPAAVYLNTGDPALAATWWPSSNNTESLAAATTHGAIPSIAVPNPKGTCAHAAGAACAFVYGYSAAQADYATVTQAPNSFIAPKYWWLDVETTNAWQTDTAANTASIEGMEAYLQSKDQTVGIYSTSYQLGKIAGTVLSTSALAGLPSWLAGASQTSAAGDCKNLPALTPGGRVVLVQYDPTGVLDYDLSCTATPVPTISGTATVGDALTANPGTWSPSTVTLTYQWLRGGVAIAGATSRIYRLTALDAGKELTVTVTGAETGSPSVSETSAMKLIAAAPVGKVFTATPVPTISGTATVGDAFTANPGTWAPGTVTLSYQWLRGGVPISGATSRIYRLVALDSGSELTVAVTGTETGYPSVSETSAMKLIAAAPVGKVFTATPVPTISGTATVGDAFTANPGTWAPATATLSYQWLRGGVAIAGATSRIYRLTALDSGKELSVTVVGTETGYTSVSKTSSAKTIAAAPVDKPFTATPVPTISGTATVGDAFTANPGTWAPGTVALTYQWLRGGVAISGATSRIYRLVALDSGSELTVTVTGTEAGYSTVSETSAMKLIAAAPVGKVFTATPVPTISGTATVGDALTVNPGTWAPGTVTLTYQWLRGGVPIAGATSRIYRLVALDSGKELTVTVTGAETGYSSVSKTSVMKLIAA